MHNTDGGGVDKQYKKKRKKGARCKCITWINNAVTSNALGDI